MIMSWYDYKLIGSIMVYSATLGPSDRPLFSLQIHSATIVSLSFYCQCVDLQLFVCLILS